MFNLNFPIKYLKEAKYNPRKITEDSLALLVQSIGTIGFAKPIVVTKAGKIIAGHQRTKACKELGQSSAPAWVLTQINTADEVSFNQLHNGTDLDDINTQVTLNWNNAEQVEDSNFYMIPAKDITGDLRSHGAVIRNEICSLIVKYGNWGGGIVNESGLVLSSAQYILACKLMGISARVYKIKDEETKTASSFFGKIYGEFSYDHLPKESWIQSFAQPYRLRGEEETGNLSHLYEYFVLPKLAKNERVLDFGCGQGDYVYKLQSAGYNILGVEFFYRNKTFLDTAAVHKMCDGLIADIRTFGLFDVVIADCVVNSVDSAQAENDVLTCLSAFCRQGGRVYFSGRRKERVTQTLPATTKITDKRRYIEFMDSGGMSAFYRRGTWFYQKWHSDNDIKLLAEKYFGELKQLRSSSKTSNWQASSIKDKILTREQYRTSLYNEFELMWPQNKTVGYGDKILEVMDEFI